MVLALVMSIINISCEKTKEGGTQAQEGSQNSALPIPGDQTQNTASTAPGMNPPHGQPGHRCDIAVGAPLDSPPGTGKTPPATGGK